MDMSLLRLYSLGIVAVNKPLSSAQIQVTPIEALPMLDGELTSNPSLEEIQGVDGQGNAYTAQVVSDNVVVATWLPMGSNRRSAPDVRRGERVFIWQYGNVDEFYWTATGWDEHLRRLETVIYTFSDTQDESADATAAGNCYYLEVSTHTGQITLQTAKANGEPFAFTLQFNTKQGCVVLTDDVGNYVELDSAATLIHLMNRMKTSLRLDKRDIVMDAPGNLDATVAKSMTFNAGQAIAIEAPQGITLKSGGSTFKLAPSGASLKAPKFEGGT